MRQNYKDYLCCLVNKRPPDWVGLTRKSSGLMYDVVVFFLYSLLPFLLLAGFAYLLWQLLSRQTEILERLADRQPAGPLSDPTAKEDTDVNGLRLQACERFTLMLERISVPNLLLRMMPADGISAKGYTAQLLLTIREEVEYNVTQQIYISDSLWSIITQARDNVSQLIVRAAEGAETATQVADRLRLMSSRQPDDAVGVAQGAIRREASSVLGKK